MRERRSYLSFYKVLKRTYHRWSQIRESKLLRSYFQRIPPPLSTSVRLCFAKRADGVIFRRMKRILFQVHSLRDLDSEKSMESNEKKSLCITYTLRRNFSSFIKNVYREEWKKMKHYEYFVNIYYYKVLLIDCLTFPYSI